MPIRITDKHILLDSQHVSYQMGVNECGLLLHLYYGKKLDGSIAAVNGELGIFSFEPYPYDGVEQYENPRHCRQSSPGVCPLEYPVSGTGDFRTPALTLRMPDGSYTCDLRFESARVLEAKPKLQGLPATYDNGGESETVEVCLKDTVYDLRVYLLYTVFEKQDVITRSARIENRTGAEVVLESALSACIDSYENGWECITLCGGYAHEREACRTPITQNRTVCESRRGASSHHKNPFMILCEPTCTETQGECFGAALCYSGNFVASAEETPIGTTRFVMGIHECDFHWHLKDGEAFVTPEVIFSYSAVGLGKLSQNFHKIIRNNLCRGKYRNANRPILINNWEATYFDFNTEKLVGIAKRARDIGVDTLVMDDGWFGARNDDTTSLGDWFVNEERLGTTLRELIDRIHALGMKFGIWFEPECVSEKSELYKAHPDWCLQVPNRLGALARNQWVLDMSNPAVTDALFAMLCRILDENPINYVKWDFNRNLTDVYSHVADSEHQGEVAHRYVLGLYSLLERLCERYPDLLIEGCSGGGGRFDCGMLYYTPQIWTSDNTDAMCRTHIQYGTSFCYPVSAVSAHISASPNHQTGRATPPYTRSSVAMAGTFGYELDLTKLSDEDIALFASETAFFRKWRDVIREGDYHRLSSPDDLYVAWEIASEDKSRALLTAVKTRIQLAYKPVIVKLRGLDETATYTVTQDGKEYGTFTGCALMNVGVRLQYGGEEYTATRFEIVRK